MAVALVTGSTKGLGLETARRLARLEHTVIFSGRDSGAVDVVTHDAKTQGFDVDGLVLDVTDESSIEAASRYIHDTYGRLDVLVNNAGILPEGSDAGSHEFASVSMFRTTFETNVFGVVAVTEALLPLLRLSERGRIVNVSSTVGSLEAQSSPASPWFPMLVPAYQTSKAALNSVTIQMAKKLSDTNIVVTSVCPGWVQTDLAPGNREQAPIDAETAAEIVVAAAMDHDGAVSGSFVDASGPVAW